MSHVLRALAAALLVFMAHAASAQDFPTRPVTIIVGVAPGGTLDALARLIAQGLSPILKQPVVVENVTGAGGLVGFQRLMNSPPDGHTLNFSNLSLLIIPHLYAKANFEPTSDVTPVAMVATVPMVLSVSNKSEIKDVQSLMTQLRSSPGKINFGSGGPGTTAHLAEALFLNLTQTNGMMIQYRGTGPAVADLMAGVIDVILDQTVVLMPLHQDKRARAIAVSAPQRLVQMADVPTFAESGLPQFDLRIWNGLLAPKGTPRAVVDRLAEAVSKVIDSPEYKDKVENQLASEIPSTMNRSPDGFQRLIKADSQRISDLVGAIGLKPIN